MNQMQKMYLLAGLLAVVLLAVPHASADGDNITAEAPDNEHTAAVAEKNSRAVIAISAGLAIGLAGISTAWAQKHIGTAAIGAIAEDRKNLGPCLIFVAIPETIIILGFVIANSILGMT